MSQKLTRQYSERLGLALKEGPHHMSVRKLAEEMRGRYKHLRGSSYGGIRQYVEGKIANPRLELLDAIADVLGVRPEWLGSDSGPMTKRQEQAQKAQQRAKSREDGSRWLELDDGLHAGMERPSPLWRMATYFYATEPLIHGLVIDFLQSGGEDLDAWSSEDIEEVTVWFVSLIEAPAQALWLAGPRANLAMRKWPEYLAAMTMAIRATLPSEGQGRPREIVTMLRAAKEGKEQMKG